MGAIAKILLVEDDPITAKIESKILHKHEIEVIHAGSGAEAIHICQNHNDIDLILMDIDLGAGQDGPETARQILAGRKVPILFVSQFSYDEIVKKVQGINHYGYLIKATGDSVLLESVQAALERARFEKEISQREQFLQDVIDSIQDGVVVLNPDFTIQQVNHTMANWNDQMETLIKKKCFHIFPGQSAHCFNCPVRRAMSNNQTEQELVTIHHQGQEKIFEISAHPIRERTDIGQIRHFVSIIRDVTHKKRIEKKFRASQKNFRNFFHTLNDLILIANLKGRILYSNPAARKALGYARKELSTMTIHQLFSQKNIAEQQFIEEILTGKRQSCALPLAGKMGAPIPVETRIWFGQWNGHETLYCISKDLSAERAALEKFETLFYSNPAPMAVSDLDNPRILDVNQAYCQHLGYSRQDVIGKTSFELNLFVDPEEYRAAAMELRNSGSLRNRELRLRTSEGQIRYGLFSGDRIQSQGGREFLTVMQDITEIKSYQVELDRKLSMERILARLAARLITIDLFMFTMELQNILKQIGDFFSADHLYIFQINSQANLQCIYSWEKSAGVDTKNHNHLISLIHRKHLTRLQNNELTFDNWNVTSLTSPPERHSAVCVPIRHLDSLSFILRLEFYNENRSWPESDSLFVRTISSIISNAYSRSYHEFQLQQQKSELEDKNKRLNEAVVRDSLTGLYNHGHIHELLEREVSESSRYNRPLSILLLDIDHFKLINDRYGHKTGDNVLIGIANQLSFHFRECDLIGRYGGEEFLVILPETNSEQAFLSADRFRKNLETVRFPQMADTVTVSIGACQYKSGYINDLIKKADALMYSAKRSGRNRVITEN